MEKRHRSVECEFNPERQRSGRMMASGALENLRPPMPEQDQPRWNGIKKSTLRHEHGQRDTLPGNALVALVIEKLTRMKELDPGPPAIEEECGDTKRAGPAIQGVSR